MSDTFKNGNLLFEKFFEELNKHDIKLSVRDKQYKVEN